MSVLARTASVGGAPAPARAPASADGLHATLVRDYPGLMAVLVRRVGDAPLARDLLQDAIVTTLTKLQGDVQLAPDALAGYVFRTALNHWKNHRRLARNGRHDGALDALADDGSPPDDSQRDASRRLVRRVLADLDSPRDREVLVRFYLDEEDKDAICAALGLSSLQFNQVVHRARERLRRGLERAGFVRWDLFVWLVVPLYAAVG